MSTNYISWDEGSARHTETSPYLSNRLVVSGHSATIFREIAFREIAFREIAFREIAWLIKQIMNSCLKSRQWFHREIARYWRYIKDVIVDLEKSWFSLRLEEDQAKQALTTLLGSSW